MLSLPSLSSAYLTTQAYGLLSALLRAPTLTLPARTILGTLLQYMPSHHALAIPWLDAVENTMVAFARTDAEGCLQKFPNVWQACWARLEDEDVACRRAAESALCAMVRYCIPDAEVSRAMDKAADSSAEVMDTDNKRKGKKALASFDAKTSIVETIITQLDASLHAVASAAASPSLLRVLASLITRLRSSLVGSTSNGAEALLTGLISYVGRLRLAKGFEYREQADEVLGTAIRVLGPKAFLDILPLNIIPEFVSLLFISSTAGLAKCTTLIFVELPESQLLPPDAPSCFPYWLRTSRTQSYNTSPHTSFRSLRSSSNSK